MNTYLKKLCIFGLATGVGNMLQNQSKDEQVKWRARKLSEAGQALIDTCQVKVDSSSFSRSKLKIDQVNHDHEQFDVLETVSFVLLGTQELRHYATDDQYIKRLELLNKRAIWFMKLFDPTFKSKVHETAYKKYYEWTEGYNDRQQMLYRT